MMFDEGQGSESSVTTSTTTTESTTTISAPTASGVTDPQTVEIFNDTEVNNMINEFDGLGNDVYSSIDSIDSIVADNVQVASGAVAGKIGLALFNEWNDNCVPLLNYKRFFDATSESMRRIYNRSSETTDAIEQIYNATDPSDLPDLVNGEKDVTLSGVDAEVPVVGTAAVEGEETLPPDVSVVEDVSLDDVDDKTYGVPDSLYIVSEISDTENVIKVVDPHRPLTDGVIGDHATDIDVEVDTSVGSGEVVGDADSLTGEQSVENMVVDEETQVVEPLNNDVVMTGGGAADAATEHYETTTKQVETTVLPQETEVDTEYVEEVKTEVVATHVEENSGTAELTVEPKVEAVETTQVVDDKIKETE